MSTFKRLRQPRARDRVTRRLRKGQDHWALVDRYLFTFRYPPISTNLKDLSKSKTNLLNNGKSEESIGIYKPFRFKYHYIINFFYHTFFSLSFVSSI